MTIIFGKMQKAVLHLQGNTGWKTVLRRFYEKEAEEHRYLPEYEQYDRNQMRKMTHLEHFAELGEMVLFDYNRRDPLTREARTVIIAKK